jgi:UDP-GlcNAc:undecaprenyl-phosphate GlcNAc-1-phosphate transferase
LSPALIIIGTVAGFLVFNFPPAKIFMGDCGALLIGYLLAVYSIQGTWHQASNLFLLLMTPVLLLGVPLFDTLVVSVQRILHGRSIYEGGKDHSSHRLVALGWSEKQAVLILYGVALLLGIIAVVGYLMNAFISIQVVLLLVVFLLVLGLFLSDVKVYKEQPAIEATPPDTAEKQTPTAPATFLVPYILHKRRLMEIFIDCILIVVAYISAYLLRFEGDINGYNWQLIQQSLPVILPIKLVALLLCGMYGGVWKYIDFDEIKKITVSSAIASLAAISTLVGIYRFSGFSRSLFFIDFMLFLFFVIGFRAVLRLLRESVYSFGKMGRNVLIVGAGEAGQWVLNEIRKDKNKRLLPVGIIDDDPWKLGRKLYGVSVIGTRLDIGRMVQEKKIQEIIIAIPSAPDSEQQAIVKICTTFAIPVKVLRDITSWSSVVPVPQQNLPDGSDSSRTDSNDGLPSPYGPGRLH